jgi:3',5'-cyclic AMP phosphodiesterase CpdA
MSILCRAATGKSTKGNPLVFRLAHLSDPHLGPLPLMHSFREFALKRLIGGLSWQLKRRWRHYKDFADLIADDIKAQSPDHIAFTGDLVNIAAGYEFENGIKWMEKLANADAITFVPGNHDAYVTRPYAGGLEHLEPYMQGNMRTPKPVLVLGGTASFPFVRLKRNVALIALSTAVPQPLSSACGVLGEAQLDTLSEVLPDLHAKGYARIILIHHPPLAHQAPANRNLSDATELSRVLQQHGAELVLHGHNHTRTLEYLPSRNGEIPISGAPSASMKSIGLRTSAGWTMFSLEREQGRWQIAGQDYSLNAKTLKVEAGDPYKVSRE